MSQTSVMVGIQGSLGRLGSPQSVRSVSLAMLLVVGCGEQPAGRVSHPIVDSLQSSQVDQALVHRIDKTPLPLAQQVSETLAASEPFLTVGDSAGETPFVFGEIAGGLLQGTTTYLIDRSWKTIRIITSSGESRPPIGREGRGPGEFFSVAAIALMGSDSLFVLDGSRRIQMFERIDNTWTFLRTIGVPFDADDLCIMGNRLFVLGFAVDRDEVIHELDLEGSIIQSFGIFYRATAEGIKMTMIQEGDLACTDSGIIAASTILPEVHSYSADGRLRWISILAPWEYPPIYEVEGGYRRDMEGAEYLDVMLDVMVLRTHDAVLIQSERRKTADIRSGRNEPILRTFVIELESGRVGDIGVAVPRMLGADGRHFVTFVNDPYPQITWWREPIR